MHKFMFLDDLHISRTVGLTHLAHRAVKHPQNPLMRREHPWEATRMQLYGHCVMYDPGAHKFRMYYLAQPLESMQTWVRINGEHKPGVATAPAYAESADGVHWTRPMLGQCSYNDIEETNLLDLMLGQNALATVAHDPRDPEPSRRYKMLYWDQKAQLPPPGRLQMEYGGRRGAGRVWVEDGADQVVWEEPYNIVDNKCGMYVAFSPDGVNWTRYSDDPVYLCYSDTGHSVHYDSRVGRWVAFGRFANPDVFPEFVTYRSVARIESEDFIHWSTPELVLCADPDDVESLQIDQMPVSLYEGFYVGVMARDVRPFPSPSRAAQLAASRDGRHWFRVADRFDFLTLGGESEWDWLIRPGSGPITFGDRVMVYYCGGRHGGEEGVGLATWRRDGFVSLHGEPAGGELLTMPFVLEGKDLHLNLDASRGSAVVRLCDNQGKEQEGWGPSEHVEGDSTDVVVLWKSGNLSRFVGRVATLRIRLRNADLYSFWCQ